MHKDIKIENIFYLLSYAWDCMDVSEEVTIGNDDFQNTDELYAKLFDIALGKIFRKGFRSEYILVSEKIKGLKGKLDISKSLKSGSFFEGYTYCEFNEFSVDHKINQIIKTTLNTLIKTRNIDSSTAKSLKRYNLLLGEINPIRLSLEVFKEVSFSNYNKDLRFILKLCELVFRQLSPGQDKFNHFDNFLISHSEMANVFEKFLRNFYKHELQNVKVKSERLHWNIDTKSDLSFIERVPGMLTDITIEGSSSLLVIDAKFYREALISRDLVKFKYRREHLSQLMEYLRISSKNYDKKSHGALVYPSVNIEIDDFGLIENFPISIVTLDLDKDWRFIKNKLITLFNKSQKNNFETIIKN